jgi:hypothetical protein
MIDIDSIRTQIAAWQQRWPHLALVSLEAHPTTVQALGVTKVDGLSLEASQWMTNRERFYFLYRRDGQVRPRRISNDDADAVSLLVGEPGKP